MATFYLIVWPRAAVYTVALLVFERHSGAEGNSLYLKVPV